MGKEIDIDQMECQKRAFWSAYTLDKYLSNALGRPQMFHDEDIDQASHLSLLLRLRRLASVPTIRANLSDKELPLSVADSDLQIASIAASLGQVDPGMQATIFQIKYGFSVISVVSAEISLGYL